MKILVTGTAGFIGNAVALRLLGEGHTVVGWDNFNDYYTVRLKRNRHARFASYRRFRGIEDDLCNAARLRRLCLKEGFDAVCHLAAQAGVRYSIDNPFAYQHSNLEGFLSVLEACRRARVPRLVYASSSSVYGANTRLPFSEKDRVDHQISLYGATKRANELMAHTYTQLFGMQTIGLRFFTVYGPWGRPDMALWLFTRDLLAGKPIKVFNNGRMRRDFTYIDDIVQGVTRALMAPRLGAYELFNLGNSRTENLMDMIRLLAATLGVEPRMDLLPLQPGDVTATFADIALARRKLGFRPVTPIRVGIPRFVQWYRDYHKLEE